MYSECLVIKFAQFEKKKNSNRLFEDRISKTISSKKAKKQLSITSKRSDFHLSWVLMLLTIG